ncbi:hypothetical protein M9Y59_25665, partial [Pseudomonas mosselii]|nr:hypothetical protein [Pseudomonas mosselii]
FHDIGARNRVCFRREAALRGAQYSLELSKPPDFPGATLFSVSLKPTRPAPAAPDVETRLCL